VTYYDRIRNPDGSFSTPEDARNEDQVAHEIERAWGMKLHRYSQFSPIDWWAERRGRVVAFIELKSRPHASTRFPTQFLNVRKWLALSLCQMGSGVESLFLVRFSDCILWIPALAVNPAWRLIIGGCSRIVKADNDIEPVIEVPIADMNPLAGGQ
jgi:hypothetical protein